MADIRFASAARAYKELSHQTAAWNWLNEQLAGSPVINQFAKMYRADPPAKEPSPTPSRPSNPLPVPFFAQQDNGPEG